MKYYIQDNAFVYIVKSDTSDKHLGSVHTAHHVVQSTAVNLLEQ